MGQFKCFVKGNYFYLVDLTTTIEYEGLRKDVFIRRHTDSSDKFFFSGVNQAPPDYEGGIHIDDILDENDTPFGSVSAFMDWYQANTGNFNGGGTAPYKVYTALLTQSGTDAPVPKVLENTIGNITIEYASKGTYIITSLDTTFPYTKTLIYGFDNGSLLMPLSDVNVTKINGYYQLYNQDEAGFLIIDVYDENFQKADLFSIIGSGTNIPIEIKVYN